MVMLAVDALDLLAATGLVAALAAAITGAVVAKSSEWVQWRAGSDKHTIELTLHPDLGGYEWNVLHIRDGNDEDMAGLSEREKWFARLRNTIRPLGEASGESARRTVTLRFYRPLGLQFKCFLDVENHEVAEEAWRLLEASGCSELDLTDERRENGRTFVRVWFLHPDTKDGGRYRIARKSGKINSFFYPV
jgi:hypothetical protein